MREIKEIFYKMDNLYNYVLWYNCYNETWYGIPTEGYVRFKGGDYDIDGLKTSNSVSNLIGIISNS
jgi:hypothetical protein